MDSLEALMSAKLFLFEFRVTLLHSPAGTPRVRLPVHAGCDTLEDDALRHLWAHTDVGPEGSVEQETRRRRHPLEPTATTLGPPRRGADREGVSLPKVRPSQESLFLRRDFWRV